MVEATKKKRERIDISESPHTPFSISAYIERMEKAYLDTLQERESEEPYEPVLWWGFDGLKLKADGTTEWISRRPKKEEHYVPQYPTHYATQYPLYPAVPQYFPYNVYQPTYPMLTGYGIYPQQYGFNPCMSIQAQTAMLESQMQALTMQLAQSQINQTIISSLNNTKEVNP